MPDRVKPEFVIGCYRNQRSSLAEYAEDLIKNKILPKLENKDQFSLARTNRRNLSIFADFLAQDLAPQLSLHVVQGQPYHAEKLILKMKPASQASLLDVALKYANVEDYSSRHFPAFRFNPNPEIQTRLNPSASPLKLARWTRDWYLVEILLMHLPQELRAKAKEQIQNVKLFCLDYGYDLLLDGEVTQKMCDEQGAAVLDGRTPVILRGCEVIMLSLPEDENIDQDVLREISEKHDEQPILIKRVDKIYLYGFSYKSEKIDREWCLSEVQHPGFSRLDFPKEFGNPQRKYLPLRKASETLTETMGSEIKEIHGEISYPYSFILMSIPEDQNEKKSDDEEIEKIRLERRAFAKRQFEKELTYITTGNPAQPILVRQGESIFLYEFRNNAWVRTQLNAPGFKDLAFPKEGYCSLKLPPRNTNETLTQEMRHEMSMAHNFVDYRVQCLGFKKMDQGTQTLAHVQVLGERCADYHPLIEALKDYVEVRTLWENAGGYPEGSLKEAVIHQWDRVMGLAQRYVTAFLAQQYCHPGRSFENVKFDEAEFRGKDRCLEFYDYVYDKNVFWFLSDSGLGSDFAIIRGRMRPLATPGPCRGHGANAGDAYGVDLRAVETLCEVSFERLASVEQKYLDDALVPSISHG